MSTQKEITARFEQAVNASGLNREELNEILNPFLSVLTSLLQLSRDDDGGMVQLALREVMSTRGGDAGVAYSWQSFLDRCERKCPDWDNIRRTADSVFKRNEAQHDPVQDHIILPLEGLVNHAREAITRYKAMEPAVRILADQVIPPGLIFQSFVPAARKTLDLADMPVSTRYMN